MITRLSRDVFLGAIGIFLLMPIVVVCAVSFNEKRRLIFPPQDITLKWYYYFFENSQWSSALQHSLIIAFSAAAVATLLALPIAYYLWQRQSFYVRLLAGMAMLPFMLPPVIVAMGFLLFWGTIGHVGQIENTIIAHGILFATLPLITISVGLNSIEHELLDAAKTMGADDKTVFMTVILPLLIPYVVSGYCFALVLSLNEYIVAYMVAGYAVETLPIKMLNSLRGGYTPAMSVGSVLFMIIGLITFSLIALLGNLPKLLGAENEAESNHEHIFKNSTNGRSSITSTSTETIDR